jgi:hypothetical protein
MKRISRKDAKNAKKKGFYPQITQISQIKECFLQICVICE